MSIEDIKRDSIAGVGTGVVRGRPADLIGRAHTEIRTYDFLDRQGIPYWQTDLGKAVYTMEECRQTEKALGVVIPKNLFLCNRRQTNFYLLIMPGEKTFRTSQVSKEVGSSRLAFAPEEWMVKLLDIRPGAVSVMGLINDKDKKVQLLIDKDLLEIPYIGCHPCVNTSCIKISVSDLLEKFLPAVGHSYMPVELF